MPLPLLTVGRPCAACLGGGRCWVCDGLGQVVRRDALPVRCTSCAGAGSCHVCRQVPHPRHGG